MIRNRIPSACGVVGFLSKSYQACYLVRCIQLKNADARRVLHSLCPLLNIHNHLKVRVNEFLYSFGKSKVHAIVES